MAVITSKLIVALVDQLTAPARGVARVVRDLQGAARANAMQLNEMRGKMVETAAAAWALGKALADPVQKAIAFESAMADVAKVSGFDDMGLNKFGADLRRLATSEIPMAVTEMAALAENAAASGIQDSELLDFTRMTAKAALAWGVSGGQAGEDLAKIREALRLTIDETMLYADAINHLSDNTASTAPDLTDFARRVAAQGEFFGFTREQSLAFGSAMISAGAPTEVAATSFRNMGRALTKGMSATPRVAKAYKTLGLDAAKVAKGMQDDAVGTTMEVISRLGQLPAEMQAAIMGDLFGDEARALAPLLSNVELLERTMGYVADETAYAGSVQAEFARRAATTEFNLQRLKNQVDEVAMAVGNALLPAVNAAALAAGPWLQVLADWISANPHVVQAIVALVGGLVALRVVTLATRWAWLFMKGAILDTALIFMKSIGWILSVLNPLNLVRNAIGALRMALMFSGIGLILAGIAAAGLWIYNNWEGLVAFFEGFGRGFLSAFEPIMPAIQPVIDAGRAILDWVMGLLGPVDASASEWANWGEVVGTTVANAILKVIEVGKSIIDFYVGFYSNVFSAIGDMIGLGASIMQGIWDGIVSKFQELLDWFSKWPDMILAAIGQIDIGALIIANLPPWLTDLFGGGGAPPPATPMSAQGRANLDYITNMPTRAAGGSVVGGKTYLVGEHGPELVTPGRNGYVHDAGATAAMMGAGGAPSVSIAKLFETLVVQAAQDPETTADAVIEALRRKLKDALGGIYADVEFGG